MVVKRPDCHTELCQCRQHDCCRQQCIPLHSSQWEKGVLIHVVINRSKDLTVYEVTPKAVMGCRFGLLEIRRHLDGKHAMCDLIKYTKSGISPPVPAAANLDLAASKLRYCRGMLPLYLHVNQTSNDFISVQ